MMAVFAVHVTVNELFAGRRAHIPDRTREDQRLTGKRMIAVDHDLVTGDIGDGINDPALVGVTWVFGVAFESHSDLRVCREHVTRFYAQKLGFVFAESIFGPKLDLALVTDLLAVQSFLDSWKNSLIASVQITDRRLGPFDQVTISIGQFVVERDYGVLGDLHNFFTRFNTSTA